MIKLKDILKENSKGGTQSSQFGESVNEATNWPREVEAYDKDVIFRREKIMGNKAKYQIINKKTNKVIEPKGRIYTTLNGLSYDAGDYILPKGGTQSSQFGESVNEELYYTFSKNHSNIGENPRFKKDVLKRIKKKVPKVTGDVLINKIIKSAEEFYAFKEKEHGGLGPRNRTMSSKEFAASVISDLT